MRLERNVTSHLGLHSVARIWSNKLAAQMANSLLTPPQLCDVRPGFEQDFLSPLPVSTLHEIRDPQGIALRTYLANLNLQTTGDLRDVSLKALEAVCGRWSHRLYRGHAELIHFTRLTPSGLIVVAPFTSL